MNEIRYRDYGKHLKSIFEKRLQKLSVDAGFTCPNIDGTKARGGCTYCLNHSFKPTYCKPKKSITEQLEEGKQFFAHKSQNQDYIAYFQAHTNTYGNIDLLRELYEEALAVPQVKGLAISTRPDCIDDEVLEYLDELSQKHFITIELGVESCNDKALEFINRAHSYAEAETAIKRIAKAEKIHLGAHLIMGLPFDDVEQCKQNALQLAELPITTLKFHQLQVLKGTVMAKQYEETPELFNLFSEESYLSLCLDIIEHLTPKVYLERFLSQVPPKLLIAPKWNRVKNFEFAHKLQKSLKERDTYQGIYYK
ncbi:MAG: TIGR01212 family radical SAM protein [Paludibacter sp.]|nr:MAG: TIGR01212 family radical SAM protein [Paludibacter sp.]